MTRMARRSRLLACLPLLAAWVSGGCAVATGYPPQRPVPDIATIAGKWSGTIEFGRGLDLFYLTINPDGSLVASWRINTQFGNVTLSGGKATFQMGIYSGDLQYLEGGGKRMIILREEFGTFYAQVTPLS